MFKVKSIILVSSKEGVTETRFTFSPYLTESQGKYILNNSF